MLAIEVALHQPGLLHLLETIREYIGSDAAQARLEVSETLRSTQQVAHDQQHPALANQIERRGHGAGLCIRFGHLSSSSMFRNLV